MNTPMNQSGARALAVGAGLTLALAMGAAPTAAMAEVRAGTTDVTVKADISNVSHCRRNGQNQAQCEWPRRPRHA